MAQNQELEFEGVGRNLGFFSTLVSLNIFLLIFFVLLNSISSQNQEKQGKLVASVVGKFAKEDALGFSVAGTPEEVRHRVEKNDFIEKKLLKDIEEHFQYTFSGFNTYRSQEDTIVVEIEGSTFFDEDSRYIIKKPFQNLLSGVAGLVRDPQNNFRVQLDVMLNANYENAKGQEEIMLSRIDQMEYYLDNRELSDTQIMVGVTMGYEDSVKFRFNVQDSKNNLKIAELEL